MLRNDPSIVFPPSPAVGEVVARRQWDGVKWKPAGLVPVWDLLPAPADGAVYGRTEGGWRRFAPFEHVLTVTMVNAQGINPAIWNLLLWDTVVVDTQGGWDNSLKRYTPNLPGLYLFQCLPPATAAVTIQKNAAMHDHLLNIAATYSGEDRAIWYHTLSPVTAMNGTSDFVNSWVSQDPTTMGPGSAINEFSAYRLPSME